MEEEEQHKSKRIRRDQDKAEVVPITFHRNSSSNEDPEKTIQSSETLHHLEPPIIHTETDEEAELNYDIILNLDAEIADLKNFEEQRRKDRLEVNNIFRNTYNNGDFEAMLTVFREHCDPKVKFVAPDMFISCEGVNALLAFYMMSNEFYPDSMVKFIEKRISTIKTPNPPPETAPSLLPPMPSVKTETVEIIDKFIGTRVIESPMVVPLKEALKDPIFHDPNQEVTVSQISQIVNHHLYSDENVVMSSQAKFYSIIFETKFTFDLSTNKIIEYTYTLVAIHCQ